MSQYATEKTGHKKTASPSKKPVSSPKPASAGSDFASGLEALAPADGMTGGTYTVHSGDTLPGIAAKVLGDANRWREIYALNRDLISNPYLIFPGMVLKLPKGAQGSQGPQKGEQKKPSSPPGQKPKQETTPPPEPETFLYVVQPKDSLPYIARTQLGDESRWKEILELNRDQISNPSLIKPGMKLKIPGRAPKTTGGPQTTPPGGKPGTLDPSTLNPTQRVAYRIYQKHHEFLKQQSSQLGIEVEVAAAILITESSGSGYGADGKLKIRFEPHIFKGYTGKTVSDTHESQAEEYRAFEQAKKIDETAAYKSISMGAAQIMGFHHKTIGYDTPQEMFDAFQASEQKQLMGMFGFIQAHPNLIKAAKNHDWETFARGYNGPGYKANSYDTKLASYFEAYRFILQKVEGR